MEETLKNDDNRIDLLSIGKLLLKQKRIFGITIGIAILIGIIVAFSIPKTYDTEVILAPEINTGNGLSGNLSDLASMVGVNLNGNSNGGVDAIYPELYPKIINSTPFLTSMFYVRVTSSDQTMKDITLFDYITKHRKMPWWNKIITAIGKLFTHKKNILSKSAQINSFKLSEEQDGVAGFIKSMISCSVDKKTSIITIDVTAQDAQIAAQLADNVQLKIQQYITDYRTKKARKDLVYAQNLFQEAKAQYLRSMQQYGSYSDANTDVVLQSYKSKQDEMENEMQLKYNIYTQCVQQLQVAKAKVQERIPAFTEIQPATVSLKKSGPKRMLIVFVFIFLDIVITSIYVLAKDAKNKINQ